MLLFLVSFTINYKNVLFSMLPCYVFLFFLCLSIFSTYQSMFIACILHIIHYSKSGIKHCNGIIWYCWCFSFYILRNFNRQGPFCRLSKQFSFILHIHDIVCLHIILALSAIQILRLILKIRLRRQGLDKVQLLDRESISAPYIRTLLSAVCYISNYYIFYRPYFKL